MKRFRDLSIGAKITTVVVVGIALQIVIALCGLYYLRSMHAEMDEIVEVDAEQIKLAARLNRNLSELEALSMSLVLVSTPERVEELVSRMDRTEAGVNERMRQLEKVCDEEDLALLAEFRVHLAAYLSELEEVRSLVRRDRGEEAAALVSTGGREQIEDANAILTRLVDKGEADLARSKAQSDARATFAVSAMIVLALLGVLSGLGFGLMVARRIIRDLERMVTVANDIAGGRLDTPVRVASGDEAGRLGVSIEKMQASLRRARDDSEEQAWLKTGLTRLNDVMRGELSMQTLARRVVREIATYLDAQVGAFYVAEDRDGEPVLTLLGSYAFKERKNLSNEYRLGEGLVGQAARERSRILVSNVPDDYIKVTSGLGEATPRFVCVAPFVYEDRVKGVIEIATLGELTEVQLAYVEQVMSSVAITLETARGRQELAEALGRAQQLTEELQAQQEELRASNEELEEQTQALKQSEEKLQSQQEELEVINEELEEKNELLERQKRDVESARRDLARKAEDLALASRYKSEFLANMSHELRTPLNSLLILARIFADNREGNLTEEQVESARVIYNSGTDLLGLINDILDLARIEAGKMEIDAGEVRVAEIAAATDDSFRHLAEDKGLRFEVVVEDDAPETVVTDRRRLDQVIKNLLSNAVKFTESGEVTVTMGRPDGELSSRLDLPPEDVLAVSVADTGIGIPPEEQKVVFEAFQQVEGGTARKYGGTGLGLSITREIVELLGGAITLSSRPGEGSTFTILVPREPTSRPESGGAQGRAVPARPEREAPAPEVPARGVDDDREEIEEGEAHILVIDDDPAFAGVLRDMCHGEGFRCVVASSGEEGMKLVERFEPAAIILDLNLPGMSGWSVLAMLKDDPRTRHIPVHIMSVEEVDPTAFRKGAIGFLHKPPDEEQLDEAFRRIAEASRRSVKDVLVVEDDAAMQRSIAELVGDRDVNIDTASTGAEARQAAAGKRYDCMILDLGLADMDGKELLGALEADLGGALPPVIVYTGRDVSRSEELELRRFSDSIIIKDVRSEERLVDEVSLFLHSVVEEMPAGKRRIIVDLHDVDRLFRDKKVLVVDDDMRTVFALSRVLSAKGVRTLKAEDGAKALAVLEREPDVDLVLMDIMMPVMDGYETMRRIRDQSRFVDLPIIALTAKAMKGDEELCIAAGASDYMPKPVDEQRLFSMMRVWLYR